MINNAGELVEFVKSAVEQHGATPRTEVFVRIGTLGPVYRISGMKGQKDERGFRLVFETTVIPEFDG